MEAQTLQPVLPVALQCLLVFHLLLQIIAISVVGVVGVAVPLLHLVQQQLVEVGLVAAQVLELLARQVVAPVPQALTEVKKILVKAV
jgi:hypothetical protein